MFKKLNLFLLVILVLGIFLRFYQLGQIPAGLTNDEADIGYDAYSILITGRDQWGQFLPINSFQGFGDFRPVLYTYLIVPFIRIFDLSLLSVRLPSAIAGSISIVAIYYLARKFFDEKVGLTAAFILAVSPWSVGLSRLGVESNVAILFVILSLIFLTNIKKGIRNLYLGLFFLALTPYTYSAYFLFAFLVLFAYVGFYYRELLKLGTKTMLGVVIFLLLISPLLLNSLTAKTRLAQVGLTTNISSIGVLQVLNDTRGNCYQYYPTAICKIFINKPTVFAAELSKNYLSHFSPNFLYLNGTTTQYSILPARGLLYMFEIIFLLSGLFLIVKSKKKEGYFVLILFLLSAVPDAITGSGNYSRASSMLPYLILIEAAGLIYLASLLKDMKQKKVAVGIASFAVLVYIFGVVSFYVSYTSYFKNYYSRYSQVGYEELIKYVVDNQNNFDKVYITRHLNDTKQYIYYLFFGLYDPALYQSKKTTEYSKGSDGWVDVSRIGKVYFVANLASIPKKDVRSDAKLLMISHPSEFEKDVKYEKDIKDMVGTTVFRIVDGENYKQNLSGD